MDELPRGAKELIALARAQAEAGPSAEARDRVRRGVALALAASSGVAAATAAGHASASSTAVTGLKIGVLGSMAGKLMLFGGAVAVIGTSAFLLQPSASPKNTRPSVEITHKSTSESRPVAQPADAPTAPTEQAAQTDVAQPAPDAPQDTPTPRLRVEGADKHTRAVTEPVEQSLRAEMALLHDASSALESGELARARQLLASHRKQFARGQLVEERQGLEVMSRCMDGGHAAIGGARKYLAATRNAVLATRIANACKLSEPQ